MLRFGIILEAIINPIVLLFLVQMRDMELLKEYMVEFWYEDIFYVFCFILGITPLVLGFIGYKIIQLVYPQRIEDNFLRYLEGIRYSECKLREK